MNAYLDGTLVASSSGSTRLAADLLAKAGVHILKIVAKTRNTSTQATVSFSVAAPVGSTPGQTSGYGNTGDPYEGGAADPSAILVTGCQTLSSNASYRLVSNIGSDATASCLKITGANTTLDLAGHTLTGRINGLGYPDINGVTIFNGTVHCDHADNAGDVGCVVLTSGSVINKRARLHHLTVANSNVRTDVGGREVHVEWSYQKQAPGDPAAVLIDHLSATVTTFGGARNYAISTVSSTNVELAYNDLRCSSNSYACQAQMCYGTSYCRVHNNRLTMLENTSGESGRAILFDASAGGEAWNNVVLANNNRAFRVRDSHNVRIHDNTIQNVTPGGLTSTVQIAAVHLADPDSGFSSAMNVEVDHNSFQMNGGTAVMTRGGDGLTFHDNSFTSVGGGRVANVRSWSAGVSALTLKNNPSDSVLPAAQVYTEAGTSVTLCNSGTAAGSGSIAYSCP